MIQETWMLNDRELIVTYSGPNARNAEIQIWAKCETGGSVLRGAQKSPLKALRQYLADNQAVRAG